ncbi:MAG: PepSY-associated TM helix domain-containing protein, partial [Sphingomicrobium sp.]
GRQIVGWVGVAMLISSLTGLWLWWPLRGTIRRGFRWNRRPDFNSNLHHLGGFWIALPLATLSLTGVWISFPAVFSGGQSGPPAPSQPLLQPHLTPDEALAAAKPILAGRITAIAWPTDRKPEWTVTLQGSGRPLDVKVRDSDASASLVPPKPETLARTMRRIHDGTGMPLVWQIIIFLGGILPALLAVTGILMWLRMRRRRRRYRRTTAELVEAEALAN